MQRTRELSEPHSRTNDSNVHSQHAEASRQAPLLRRPPTTTTALYLQAPPSSDTNNHKPTTTPTREFNATKSTSPPPAAPKMARKRKDPKEIKLAHPSRAEPTEKTLLQWAEERDLFAQAQQREREKGSSPGVANAKPTGANKKPKRWDTKTGKEVPEGEGEGSGEEDDEDIITPGQERVFEAILWAFTISSVHFMLDVLVHNQYAIDIMWWNVVVRTGQAFLGKPSTPDPCSLLSPNQIN